MFELAGVSRDVSEAARALANLVVVTTHDATRAGYTTGPDVQAFVRANDAPIRREAAYLAEVVRCDITEAVQAERHRCRMVEYSEAVRAARMACAETRAILEPTVWKLAEAQNVHRKASDAYRRAFDGLEAALELADAGTVD